MAKLFFWVLIFFIIAPPVWAAERVELADEDEDGRRETKIIYEGSVRTRAEVDKNGDGKTDRYVQYRKGIRAQAQNDSDYDGAIDGWDVYNSKGELERSARDTNKDGRPDQFKEFLQGRNLYIEERDKNYDERIDFRAMMAWDGNKKIPVPTGTRLTYQPNPGYVSLWKEEDTDFDGKVDKYYEKNNKEAGKDKIGKPMNPQRTQKKEKDESGSPNSDGLTPSERKIKELNQRYGLGDE